MNIFSIFGAKKVVGLYVSQETVDLVVMKGTLSGPKLVKFGQTYIYPKNAGHDHILPEQTAAQNLNTDNTDNLKKTKEEYIVEAIKRVFMENNVKPGNVITAISSEDAMVRYFQMPKIPKQEWEAAVNFEAKRYIPFRLEDVVSDFQVVPSRTGQNNMDVVFIAAKKTAIEQFISLLNKAGVKPIIVEPAPFSLIRALNAAEQINHRVNTAIIDISLTGVSIDVLRNGVPYIIRDIPLNGEISEEQSIEPIFEKLLTEIKLSFDFYEKQFPNEIIDKILIYSTVPLENWHELLGKELQVPIEVGDPLRGIRVKKSVIPAKLAICFGLAMRGLSSPFIDINLCKEKMMFYKKQELFLRVVFLEASAAVFLLILFRLFTIKAIEPLDKELKRTLSERPKIEININADSLNVSDLEKIKNELEARKGTLENLLQKRTYATVRLSELARITFGKIWLQELNYEEKADARNISKISRSLRLKGYCIIDGKTNETDLVNNYLSDLKKSVGINNGMNKADILAVNKTELNNNKVASFEILFTGP